MTRKDYILIADALREAIAELAKRDAGELLSAGAMLAASELSYRLQDDNPRFDRARFLSAVLAPQ